MAPAHLSYLGKIQTEVSIDDPPRATRSSSMSFKYFKMQKIYLPGRPKIPEITDLAQDIAVEMLSYFEIVGTGETGISLGYSVSI